MAISFSSPLSDVITMDAAPAAASADGKMTADVRSITIERQSARAAANLVLLKLKTKTSSKIAFTLIPQEYVNLPNRS